ncbi:MAG: hypothetical protein OZSIB_4242 [Candidatus Ozemobacter sibiricus]|uniref:Uncharacterized protein n=1 Tax=Candidatus Ozemobacter sibiricus TaxID=2268124 RepID=A0A367ZMY2_9BACT|nr:MAG: hypothetical protein OZSIB_4242 [Candidatus Ozemobacter sibiricus]
MIGPAPSGGHRGSGHPTGQTRHAPCPGDDEWARGRRSLVIPTRKRPSRPVPTPSPERANLGPVTLPGMAVPAPLHV